jgi:hypothetical protein
LIWSHIYIYIYRVSQKNPGHCLISCNVKPIKAIAMPICNTWIYMQYWAGYNQNKNIYYLTSITTLFYANFGHF